MKTTQDELLETLNYDTVTYDSLDEYLEDNWLDLDKDGLQELKDDGRLNIIDTVFKPYPDRFVPITNTNEIVDILFNDMYEIEFDEIVKDLNADEPDPDLLIDLNNKNEMLDAYLSYYEVTIIKNDNQYILIVDYE